MPQMKTLVELFHCFKQLAILRRPFLTCSGESWYRHCLKTFLKDEKERESCAYNSTCCILSLSIPQLRTLSG